jgi:NAD-dependent deacetylase
VTGAGIDPGALEAAARALQESHSALVITGAGISAESGLPTYRGIGGLYEATDTDEGIPIEVALSGEMLKSRPEVTWRYLRQIGDAVFAASPSPAHRRIAELETCLDRVVVLTQNVDGFHRSAGSSVVVDIHGDCHDLRCDACGGRRRVDDYSGLSIPPECPTCGSAERPDVVLFGEMLPAAKLLQLSEEMSRGFDVVLSIGTTSVFAYIAGPVVEAARSGRPTIEINPGDSEISQLVSVRLRCGAGEALEAILMKLAAPPAGP